ncbi:MAG TPA: hypothetical protein VEV84_01380 [Pyrinomonadaceae bacterium]|nr:hypothetical protein [Pyrinomonadaceae bacterium]
MKQRFITSLALPLTLAGLLVAAGCSVEASKATPDELKSALKSAPAKTTHGATIEIEPNGPADTVRAFYKLLREKKFRDAIFLTNLRPAIDGLTDAELKEFDVDFQSISAVVPPEIEINGEIVTGDLATVTAKLPTDDGDKLEIQEIKLRKDGGVWVILSADEESEKKIQKEGKNYFYTLRIETHEEEARKMLDRIAKAEMVYAVQNSGLYGEMPQLVLAGLLPDDAETTDSTGYKYNVNLSGDKKSWSAKAMPAVYGKTGKLTFTVELNDKKQPHLTSKDQGK